MTNLRQNGTKSGLIEVRNANKRMKHYSPEDIQIDVWNSTGTIRLRLPGAAVEMSFAHFNELSSRLMEVNVDGHSSPKPVASE